MSSLKKWSVGEFCIYEIFCLLWRVCWIALPSVSFFVLFCGAASAKEVHAGAVTVASNNTL